MTGNDGIVIYAPVNPIGSLREAWSKASIESQFHKPGKTSTCPPPLCKSNRHSARQPTGKSSLVKSTCGVHDTWARSSPGALREREKNQRKISNCLKLTSKVQRAVRYIQTWPEQTNFKQSQVLPPTNTIITVSHSPPPPKIVHILQRFFHRRAQIFYSLIVVSTQLFVKLLGLWLQ